MSRRAAVPAYLWPAPKPKVAWVVVISRPNAERDDNHEAELEDAQQILADSADNHTFDTDHPLDLRPDCWLCRGCSATAVLLDQATFVEEYPDS